MRASAAIALVLAIALSLLAPAIQAHDHDHDHEGGGFGLRAQLKAVEANLTQQLEALSASVASVASNVDYIYSIQELGTLTPASQCTTLDCVRGPINAIDTLIMQLYSKRLSYAVQAAYIKYAAGANVLDASRETVVIEDAVTAALANDLPAYAGYILFGNDCMLYVSKRMEVEALNAAYNAGLPLPHQHTDNITQVCESLSIDCPTPIY